MGAGEGEGIAFSGNVSRKKMFIGIALGAVILAVVLGVAIGVPLSKRSSDNDELTDLERARQILEQYPLIDG